ncbi:DUF1028 domain-containing protein [Halomarina oriensis]|uniref:DUF1028 domain-containing protein n=1 Tax=Halomarina oriensis TaxID=671145 RepID=A0A6B0GUF7_9EURY|nr:DUF1028 domain-containing protein [Halomarina oriensis]
MCVREEYRPADGEAAALLDEEDSADHYTRFGVAVTTRLPGVGTLCPFVGENGAIATQSLVNVRLGRKGIAYLDDGLAIDAALEALLDADDGRAQRQLHGVDRDGTFAFSGEECNDWYGHHVGENYTVAGNLLTGESVVEAVAEAYEATANDDERPLAERLVDALAAGHAEGGDRREDLPIQSAALRVVSDEPRDYSPYYDDLRVDASETPVADLKETYELARQGYEDVLDKYDDGEEDDPDAE